MTKIEIDLKDLGLPTGEDEDGPTGSRSLTDLIIEAAADKLIGSDWEMRNDIRQQIQRTFKAKIDEKVQAMIVEAFDEPIQKTTPWGETKGEETTVREIIRESLEKFLQGNAKSRDGYSRDSHSLTELINNETIMIMSKELKATIEAAKKTVHEKVTEAALKAAVDVLAK